MFKFNRTILRKYSRSLFASKIVYSLFILLFINTIISNAQIVKCGNKPYKIKEFKNDSSYTFENQFVKSGKIENIKKSRMLLEIRIYMIDGFTPERGTILSLKGNGKNIVGSLISIMIVDRQRARPEDMVTKDGLKAVVELNRYKNYTFNCDIIDSVINNGLLTMSSSNQKEFKRNKKGIMDAQVEYIYEIKVGNHFRNFNYVNNGNLDDQVLGRKEKITSFIKYLLDNLKK